jgi:iron-sulfur cluster repair protein YtfE (RIC family)
MSTEQGGQTGKGIGEARQDGQRSGEKVLDESLGETFPASDPIASSAAEDNSSTGSTFARTVDTETRGGAIPGDRGPIPFPTSGDGHWSSGRTDAGHGESSRWSLRDASSRMGQAVSRLSPTITNMIRMDHTHVMATWHQYAVDASPGAKRAIANTISLALEVHAQLEEEIFYPALREYDVDMKVLDKSEPEHDEMRRLIGELQDLDPREAAFDDTLAELMRDVMHHVADEETVLLPAAERELGPQRLSELGAQMTRRRFQLIGPRTGELVRNHARVFPTSTVLMTVAAATAGLMLVRSLRHRRVA